MSETDVQSTEAQVVDTDDLDAFSSDFFGQKPAEETPAPETKLADAEQDDTEAAEVAETDAQEPEVDPEEDEAPAPPKKKTTQDRIDELVRQREETRREAKAEIEAIRKEFAEKLAGLAPQTPHKPATAEPTPLDTLEDGTEKYALGEFDPQYIRDLTRYTLATERAQAATQAEEARKVTEETQARTALVSDWNQKLETAKTEYPDLVEKGQTLLDGFGDLDPNYAGYLSTVLMSMDKGPDVLYYLSNHPEEAAKLVNSGAQKATLALGRIEAKFLEADAQKLVAKPKISKAPTPPAVQARGTNGAFITVAPDTDNLNDFEAEFFRKK